jgi:ribosomal protein S18 acetylase RimI-like enzyme
VGNLALKCLMQLRSLVPSDASAFQALRLQGLLECSSAFASSHVQECALPLDVVAERLAAKPDAAMLGAFVSSTLAGIVGLQREGLRKLAHKALIWGLYVAPEFRRQRVARRLVDEALRMAFSMTGIRQVNLGVNAANVAAIALYESAGFTRFGVERAFMIVDGVEHDELHMVCLRESVRR